MNVVDKAFQTQLKNIQTRTGKSLEELYALIRRSGLGKHGEIRDMLKRDLGLGHGDANSVAKFFFLAEIESRSGGDAPSKDEELNRLYPGPKSGLRPIHEKLMEAISAFGAFEIAPKKDYLSLRRKKQFAMLGPGSQTRLDLGLNMKGVAATSRLIALPAGGMCQYRVKITEIKEVDEELLGWLKTAYEAAG